VSDSDSNAMIGPQHPDEGLPFAGELDVIDARALAAALMQTVHGIVVALDGDGRVVELNPQAERITGYSRDEIAGRSWFELICPPERYPEVWEEFNRLSIGGPPAAFENSILTKSGEERRIQWSNTEWHAGSGQIRTISVGIDVTNQRQREGELTETNAMVRAIVEGAPSAIFAKDLEGRYLLMNSLAAEFLGKPREEILGKTDADLFAPELARAFVDGDRRVIESGQPLSYTEVDMPPHEGAWRYRLVTKGPIRDELGNVTGVFGITSDLTESLHAEKTIAKTARENEQLARAATALITCTEAEGVFNVAVAFFSEVVPDHIVILNQSINEGRAFVIRHVTGADDSMLMQTARLLGFDVVGREFPVTDEYRRDFFSTTLTQVPGGFATLAGAEVPQPVIAALRSALGLHDTYTIGIRSRTTEFGAIHIITRAPNAEMPSRLIDAFVRQCVLALSSIRRRHEIADYQDQLQSLLAEREQQAESLAIALSSVIEVVGRTVELRDPYTAGHQRRVAQLAEQIARRLDMADPDVEDIRIAALMHDVGKVTLPAEILSKPGRLTDPEYELVKNHSRAGYEIVQTARMREPVAEMIYQHQERCDGSGYPRQLRADELHPGSKVIMVADVVEAMASHRPYRPAIGLPEAIAEIEAGAGARYDAEVVAACIAVFDEGFNFDESESPG
jgi:PAS domain S-box-containing protein/putative nucleotidyltransferase with HDIG domain